MSGMQRGFAFKLMAPKAIVDVLALIGAPPVTCENITKPSAEVVATMYQALAEFCYDLDVQQLKTRAFEVPSVAQYMEIFDEALDVVAILRFTKQLAFINRVENFSTKDIWDPQSKRLRAILSGIINFCRYKEKQTGMITTMTQEIQQLDHVRLELVEKLTVVGAEVAQAQVQHSAELQDMREAENVLQEARDTVEKLQKQRQTADRLYEQADTKVQTQKETLEETELRMKQQREHIASLQEQVAESPEGLERELQELQATIRHQKARVDEKSDEKRSRIQRVQILSRFKTKLDSYKDLLEKLGQAITWESVASDRSRGAHGELASLRSSLECRQAEELDLGQTVELVSQEMDSAKQAHEEHMQQFEERRQQAVAQLQALQEKRTEEQRHADMLYAQGLQVEAEIAAVKRAYEAETSSLQARLRQVQEGGGKYIQTVEDIVAQYTVEVASCTASPGSARREVGACAFSPAIRASPAEPKRLIMDL